MSNRALWYSAILNLNQMLGTYQLEISRETAQMTHGCVVAGGNGAEVVEGPAGAVYVYRMSLQKGRITVTRMSPEQPEVMLPSMAVELMNRLQEGNAPPEVTATADLEAFSAAVDAAVLEREAEIINGTGIHEGEEEGQDD